MKDRTKEQILSDMNKLKDLLEGAGFSSEIIEKNNGSICFHFLFLDKRIIGLAQFPSNENQMKNEEQHAEPNYLECCGNCESAFTDYDGFGCIKSEMINGWDRKDELPIMPWTRKCEEWELRKGRK